MAGRNSTGSNATRNASNEAAQGRYLDAESALGRLSVLGKLIEALGKQKPAVGPSLNGDDLSTLGTMLREYSEAARAEVAGLLNDQRLGILREVANG